MKQPTEKQFDEARRFIIERVKNEKRGSDMVRIYMLQAAKEIISISKRYNITPLQFKFSANENLKNEVNEVIRKLNQDIYDSMVEYSVMVNQDDEDTIIGIIENYDVKRKISTYTNRYKYEVEAFIAAAMLNRLSTKDTEKEILNYINSPYLSPVMKNGYKYSPAATRLKTKGVSFGVGQYTSSYNSLQRLEEGIIGGVWMLYDEIVMKNSGAIGFYQYRGSAYPCQVCDDERGFHPFGQFDWGYPHPHCKCFRIPVYVQDLIL